jgi:hypothetical protein
MINMFGAFFGIIFLARMYVDFVARKPWDWTSQERGFRLATAAFVLLLVYVGTHDQRGLSGSAYFLMFIAVPAWLTLLTGFGLRAVHKLLSMARS